MKRLLFVDVFNGSVCTVVKKKLNNVAEACLARQVKRSLAIHLVLRICVAPVFQEDLHHLCVPSFGCQMQGRVLYKFDGTPPPRSRQARSQPEQAKGLNIKSISTLLNMSG